MAFIEEEINMGNNLLIAQSGGPTAVINASLAGVIQAAFDQPDIDKVYGALHGLEGVLNNRILDLGNAFSNPDLLEKLKRTPAMALGSCRFKLAKTPDKNYEKIAQTLRELKISYFLYNGGNDSMDTVDKLSNYFERSGMDVKCIGIPKTIDNDLVETDHTPGYGSAARFVAQSIRDIYCDSAVYDRHSVTIVEIMGRNAGWLTAASVLARSQEISAPHLVYLPEKAFDRNSFLQQVEKLSQRQKTIIIAVSEGIKFPSGEYVNEDTKSEHDSFGHAALAGSGRYLEHMIRTEFGFKTRTIEFSTLQRSAAHLASSVDLKEAYRCGLKAVEFAAGGYNRVMVSIQRISDNPYLVKYVPVDVSKVANKEKLIPEDWITTNGIDLTQDFINYVKPLLGKDPFPSLFMFLKEDLKTN